MKRSLGIFLILGMVMMSCGETPNEDVGEAPQVPSASTLEVDYNGFQSAPKVTSVQTSDNFSTAALLATTMGGIVRASAAIPKTILAGAQNTTPEYIGDSTWKWTFTADGEEGSFTITLLAVTDRQNVNWEFYVTTSAGNLDWNLALLMSGTSTYDGSEGMWLIHNPENEEVVASTVWEFTDDSNTVDMSFYEDGNEDPFASILYTYADPEKTLVFDNLNEDTQTVIKWNTTTGEGSLTSDNYNDGEKACWDSSFQDVSCPV
ncbi:MAG TPA: hypothetical protein DEQ34_01260 [Balneolaceae bacterium]|nr:hypothetical protein [Balneolaceae bacterium]|tara:strand:+ start:131056 stop:131841 length:786 start_codon:yes stop_codon:yes gene_type:complete